MPVLGSVLATLPAREHHAAAAGRGMRASVVAVWVCWLSSTGTSRAAGRVDRGGQRHGEGLRLRVVELRAGRLVPA